MVARHRKTVRIGDGWEIDVPGSMAEEREDDNALVLWDERRTIRIKTVTVAGRRDGSAISAEEMAGDEDARYRVERSDDVILELPPQREETIEGERVWTVPARAAAPNSVILAYFHSRSPEDEEWARSTATSIRHGGERTRVARRSSAE
jgi:hypothetical protein